MTSFRAKDSGGNPIQLGSLLTGLLILAISSGGAAITTVAVLAWRANASEEEVEKLDKRQRVVERNVVVLDANQRELLRDSDWTQRKLDKLLKAAELDVPDRPPKPASSLVEPAS